jgi:hypothetical protein
MIVEIICASFEKTIDFHGKRGCEKVIIVMKGL